MIDSRVGDSLWSLICRREAAQCPDVVVATQFTRNEGESIKNQYSEVCFFVYD